MSSSRPLAVVVQLSAREPSDAQLVTRVLAGAKSAQEALYMRHCGPVLSLCLRLLGDRDEAEDALQETFLEVFEALHTLRQPSRLPRFIAGIAVSKAEALFRRRRTQRLVLARSHEAGASFLPPAGHVSREVSEQLGQLDAQLGRLGDRDRACWLLHTVDGYTLAEISSWTHRPLTLVRRRLQRAQRTVCLDAYPALTPPLVSLLEQARPEDARELLRVFLARRELRASSHAPMARWLRIALGLALVLALVLLGVDKHARHEVLPLTLRDQRNLPSAMLTNTRHHAFDLSDGSRITLAPGARVEVLESTARALVLAQRAGRVRFDIQRSGQHSWRIESGVLSVETLGGQLVIERGEHVIKVEVEQGDVVLEGTQVPDRVQKLRAGQSFVATI